MKILFIKPRYFDRETQTFWTHVLPPDGIARLATSLLQKGYECLIYDMEPLKASYKDLKAFLEKERPQIVGVEVETPLFHKSQMIAKIARQVLPEALILAGGAHTFIEPEYTLRNIPEVDYVLRGECENTLGEFLEAYNKGKRKFELSYIPGVCFRNDESFIVSKDVPLIQDMETVPFGAFHLLPLDKYYDAFYPARRLYAPVTCRGCPNFCNFCGEPLIYGHKARAESPTKVVEQIEILLKEYFVEYIVFQDATFNFSIQRVKQICEEIIKRNLHFKWKVKARVDHVDEEMLRLMKEAGCDTIGFGVESASERSLEFLHKGFTPEQIRTAFALANKVGIKTLAYFMLGTEGETEEDLRKTIRFSIELKPTYSHYMITTPMYRTSLYSYYESQLKDVPLEKYLFFTGIVNTDSLSAKVIKKYHQKAHVRFYFRPTFFWQEIKRLRNFRDLLLKMRYGFFMLGKLILK